MSGVTPYELLARFPDRSQPLVTHYAGPTGRVELSVASVANAVAKAAGLLRDGLGLEPGEATVSVDLPRHWQLPIWTMAALTVGARVGRSLDEVVDVRIVGPAALTIAGSAEQGEGQADVEVRADQLLVSACDAFGLPLPAQLIVAAAAAFGVPVLDVGIEARVHPDLFTPEAGAGDAALIEADGFVPWAARAAAMAAGSPRGSRLWVDDATAEADLLTRSALVPLVLGGSVVIGIGLTPAEATHVRSVERVSDAT